jgi:hypothetical protein
MKDGLGVSPVGGAAAWEVWLEQRPVDEDGSQEFQPPAVAGWIGTEIDERRVAKLSGCWGVHVSSSILLTVRPPRRWRLKPGQNPQACQENQR